VAALPQFVDLSLPPPGQAARQGKIFQIQNKLRRLTRPVGRDRRPLERMGQPSAIEYLEVSYSIDNEKFLVVAR